MNGTSPVGPDATPIPSLVPAVPVLKKKVSLDATSFPSTYMRVAFPVVDTAKCVHTPTGAVVQGCSSVNTSQCVVRAYAPSPARLRAMSHEVPQSPPPYPSTTG